MSEIGETSLDGRGREVVAMLQRHALGTNDPRPHAALANMRRSAAREAMAQARPRPDWPPPLPDPFPGCTGIPEIGRAALDARTMGGTILHHGSLLVRGLIDGEHAGNLREQIDQLFDDYDEWSGGDPLQTPNSKLLSLFQLRSDDPLAGTRPWNRAGGGIWGADAPVLLSRLMSFYEENHIISAIEEYLGERPVISVGKTAFRRVEPTQPGDFHQDGAFLGADVRTINVWIALSDCGIDAPALEVIDRRLPHVVETGTGDAFFPWSTGREMALRTNGGRPFARPVFNAGDALIFDQLMLHATSYDSAMTKPRFAIECWFFAPSTAPEDQIPLLI